MGYGCEAGGDQEKVAEVAAEAEGGAGGAFQAIPLAADESGAVAATDV